eukprot:11518395-Alexandrium_andersonii.AAC.1
MSASLVGSEMCIRDSSIAAHLCRRSQPASDNEHPTMRPVIPRHSRASGTVSYTHLTLPTICSV